MCNKNRKYYGFYSGKKECGDQPQRLVDNGIKCDFVILSVWNTENDNGDTLKATGASATYSDSNEEVFWGFSDQCVHQLFPMDTTNMIPVKDAGDIFIRRNKKKGTTTMVAFSCFKEVEDDD